MGAIAVYLARTGSPDRDTVVAMLSAVPHRGDQHHVETLGHVALGVTNDPDWVTATIAQGNDWLAVFCGVLDNHAEIRAELFGEGLAASDRVPAETLLAAHARWGEGATGRLRGSFAGAITDGREVWCLRDHFGGRPFFFNDGPTGFFAGTEVKQVLAGSPTIREPDLDHLHGLLFGGIERSTAYQGVERVPKNTIARVGSQRGVSFREYWDPSQLVETSRVSPREAVEGTVDALDRAVRRQLTGQDVLLLSGGLDSPSIAVFASGTRCLSSPVLALTALYPDYPSVDEREWTEMAATHVGMPLHSFIADAGSMDDVEYWVEMLDGPVDVVSIPESAEAYGEARKLGARTVLNGEIAEHLFDSRAFLLDHLLSHGRIRAAARVLGWAHERGRTSKQLARDAVLAIAPNWVRRAYGRRRPRRLPGVASWIDRQRFLDGTSKPGSRSVGARHRWMRIQTSALFGPGTQAEADEICAAVCGVDTRRPFTDVDLWEFVLSLPAEVKYPTARTKPLLRDAMGGLLPYPLIDRTDKTAFNEFHIAKADYPKLRALLVGSRHRLDGVDYALLEDRLQAAEMPAWELQWARDVARIHVFLNQW